MNVAAASDSCTASSAPSRRQVPLTTFARTQELEFLPLGDHYQQALDQALELYALTDPDASDDVVQTTAMEAAWKDTLAEALRIQHALPRPQQWPPGWAGIMQEAQEM